MISLRSLFIKRRNFYPGFVQDYLGSDFKGYKNGTLLNGRFCVIDCETSGLGKHSKIITLGGVKIDRRDIIPLSAIDLIFPHVESTIDSEIHEELKNSLDNSIIESNIQRLLNFISGNIIVGHNIQFDISRINQLLAEYYPGLKISNKILDTVHLEKRIDPVRFQREIGGNVGLSLDNLCQNYRITIENRHTALGDAYLTAQVLLCQLSRLQKRGVTWLKNL